MQDHPIKELKDMRGEFHANPHTRTAIILCSALAALFIVIFLIVAQVTRTPALPVDPVAVGAERAFDVAPAPPAEGTPVVQPYDAAPPSAPAKAEPPLVIAPADITPQ